MSSTSDNGCDSVPLAVSMSPELENKEEGAIMEDDINDGAPTMNPLFFLNVITKVFKHLPANDVEVCRLVNKTWNEEACKVLRTKRVVVFLDGDAIAVYMNAMEGTTFYPHAQFELCMDLSDRKLEDFWTAFGPQVESLDIRSSTITWRELLDVLENKTPNLTRLSLRYLPRHDPRGKIELDSRKRITKVRQLRLASMPMAYQGAYGAVERLTDLFKLMPNLEVIEFLRIKGASMQAKVSEKFVEALAKPEVTLSSLNTINLGLISLNSDKLDALASKSLPLKRVEMTLAEAVKATSLKDFLLSLRKTLTDLKITFPEKFTNYQPFLNMNDSMRPDESVQVLTNLKSLTMTNFRGSIYFAYKLPELTKLIYTTDNLKDSIPMGFRRRPYVGQIEDHNLNSLKVTSPFCPADTATLNGIAMCFPYLKSLALHNVDDEGLGVIYRELPHLSELILHSSTCTDNGLTGIPTEICIDMVETDIFTVVKPELYRQDLFIGCLPSLRTFSVTSPNITDAAVAFGIVCCKYLKELHIGSPLITDKGIIFLVSRLCKDLNVLDLSKSPNLTEESTFYANAKLIGKVIVPEPEEEGDEMEMCRRKMKEKKWEYYPDRGIVKTKRGESLISRMASPDINFFEEVDIDHAHQLNMPDHNRHRNVRIRVHAFRRFENQPFEIHYYGD